MTGLLAQQGADLVGGIVDFDLEHRVSRLEFSARCFSGLDSVKLRLEMPVNNRHESFGGGPVGAGHFLRRWLVNRENRFLHRLILLSWSLQRGFARTDGTTRLKVKLSCSFGVRTSQGAHGSFGVCPAAIAYIVEIKSPRYQRMMIAPAIIRPREIDTKIGPTSHSRRSNFRMPAMRTAFLWREGENPSNRTCPGLGRD